MASEHLHYNSTTINFCSTTACVYTLPFSGAPTEEIKLFDDRLIEMTPQTGSYRSQTLPQRHEKSTECLPHHGSMGRTVYLKIHGWCWFLL